MSDMKVFREISRCLYLPDYFGNLDRDTVAIWNGLNGESFKVIQKEFHSQYIARMSCGPNALQAVFELMSCFRGKTGCHNIITTPGGDEVCRVSSYETNLMSGSELMEWFQKNLETIKKVLGY